MAIEENDRMVPFVETRHHAPHIVGASALGEEHCCKDGRNDCSHHSSLLDQLITKAAPRTECLLLVWINLGLKSRGASAGSCQEAGWCEGRKTRIERAREAKDDRAVAKTGGSSGDGQAVASRQSRNGPATIPAQDCGRACRCWACP